MLKYSFAGAQINQLLIAVVTFREVSKQVRLPPRARLRVRANFEFPHGRGAGNAPFSPSGFTPIPPILRRNRISACIDDLPPTWITPIGDRDASTSDTDKIVLPLTQQKFTSTNCVN
jgi:hypothetical protein